MGFVKKPSLGVVYRFYMGFVNKPDLGVVYRLNVELR